MKSLFHQIVITVATTALFTDVSASKAAPKGTLTLTSLKKSGNLLPGAVSVDTPELVSLVVPRDIPDPWIMKRQGGNCPPAYPVLVCHTPLSVTKQANIDITVPGRRSLHIPGPLRLL